MNNRAVILISLFFILRVSLSISEPSGTISLRIRCPKIVTDCHVARNCYSKFNICLNSAEGDQCVSVPALVDQQPHCSSGENRVVTIIEFPIINASRVTMRVTASERTIFNERPPFTEVYQLLPGIKTLSNATVPNKENWTELTIPGKSKLLFGISAILQCSPNRYGPLCVKNEATATVIAEHTTPTPAPTNFTKSPCQDVKCKNDGVCFLGAAEPLCNCSLGWKGRHCEYKDLCFSIHCVNGGTCQDRGEQAACICRSGWLGFNCEIADPCSSHPCRNGGNCSTNGKDYKCRCPLFYIGTNCEVKLSQSFTMDPTLIVILVSVGLGIFIVFFIFLAIFLVCRRSHPSKSVVMRHSTLDNEVSRRRRNSTNSEFYAKIYNENCYSETSSGKYEMTDDDGVYVEESRPSLPERPITINILDNTEQMVY